MKKITSIDSLRQIAKEYKKIESKYEYILHVCFGASCVSSGSEEVADALNAALDKYNISDKVLIRKTGCIGACDKGPSLYITPGDTYYTNLVAEDMERIVSEHLIQGNIVEEKCYLDDSGTSYITNINDIPFFNKQKKIVLNNCGVLDYSSIDGYISREGYIGFAKAILEMTPKKVVNELKESGLRGRGGGGFPTGLKLELALKEKNDMKYLVCNADEGDPGAFMDRALLEGDPHAVLEGMLLAGYGIGASKGFIYVRAEYPLAIERIEHSIKQAREYGLLGKNIMGTDFSFDIEIRIGAGAFVCGEETSLMHSIEGKRGEPRQKPPFPSTSGIDGKPTVINNVETLANIAKIILKGANWFRQFGTEDSKGTKIFALAGAVKNTGIIEVPMGTTLGEVLFDIGGGTKNKKQFKAAQTGGPSGGCLTPAQLNTPIDYDSLKVLGSIMGSGGLISMDEDNCMVDVARYFMEFVKDESCGKCLPCRVGTTRMLEILEKITKGHGEEGDIEKLIELGENIKESALCGLGQTAPNPVLSTIKWFRDEYEEHIYQKKCRAGVCQEMMISPCENACPAGVNVPGYLALISANKVRDAYDLIRQDNPFPAVCGRVCTHPCESKCRRGQVDEPIAIAALKRYAADVVYALDEPFQEEKLPLKDKSVGIIGGGPSGLSAGYHLARLGYDVTVYEAADRAGGCLALTIPEYRLPRDILHKEIKAIENIGVKILRNMRVGKDIAFEEVKRRHDAVYIATGTHIARKMGIKGENLAGVYPGFEILQMPKDVIKRIVEGKKIAVIGGGNTAIDVARVTKRLGAKSVEIIYRRTIDDMPADELEIREALYEGVIIHTMVNPVAILGNKEVEKIRLLKHAPGRFDDTARKVSVPIEGSEYDIDVDVVIPTIRQNEDLSFMGIESIKLNSTSGTSKTDIEGVFAGGDVLQRSSTVIEAIADGKQAAIDIDIYLGGKGILNKGKEIEIPKPDDEQDLAEHPRFTFPSLPLEERQNNFNEVFSRFDKLSAIAEAMRCLRCDRR